MRVTDHGPGRPHRLDLGQDAVSGRGIGIVEALADQWGVVPVRNKVGKTVWAAWRLPCERPGTPRTVGCADSFPSHS
ncbi:ATP-binding protein [Streptosporangium sp. NPDC000396]|uniref:ATP-binding protein n=1 Tax=Streptosporangium sp. NPDC000396 TaxID=3366185 RepID=UPI0036BC1BD8